MKKRIIVFSVIVFICLAISPAPLPAKGDKIKHFGVSFLFGAAGESYLHYATELKGDSRVIFGTALGTLPGLFKEIVDSTEKDNRFSGGDFAADIFGSFCGAFLSNTVNNKIQMNVILNKKREIWIVSVRCSF
ncbi:MAG: hypothetical protein MUP98_14215 [Candidatus Aminicenantes bacterium]|nr:hypothetical protein [Candidatus Aminicenantes bacterium]